MRFTEASQLFIDLKPARVVVSLSERACVGSHMRELGLVCMYVSALNFQKKGSHSHKTRCVRAFGICTMYIPFAVLVDFHQLWLTSRLCLFVLCVSMCVCVHVFAYTSSVARSVTYT